MDTQHSHGFNLTINSLQDFAAFVAIIRGEDIDNDRIKAMTASLNASSEELAKAEANAAANKG